MYLLQKTVYEKNSLTNHEVRCPSNPNRLKTSYYISETTKKLLSEKNKKNTNIFKTFNFKMYIIKISMKINIKY